MKILVKENFEIKKGGRVKKIIPIEIRYGMVAPKIYIRIFNIVIMWWGLKNGKLEIRRD